VDRHAVEVGVLEVGVGSGDEREEVEDGATRERPRGGEDGGERFGFARVGVALRVAAGLVDQEG
jgi:hypothetical protein